MLMSFKLPAAIIAALVLSASVALAQQPTSSPQPAAQSPAPVAMEPQAAPASAAKVAFTANCGKTGQVIEYTPLVKGDGYVMPVAAEHVKAVSCRKDEQPGDLHVLVMDKSCLAGASLQQVNDSVNWMNTNRAKAIVAATGG